MSLQNRYAKPSKAYFFSSVSKKKKKRSLTIILFYYVMQANAACVIVLLFKQFSVFINICSVSFKYLDLMSIKGVVCVCVSLSP
jgi:hypothetical protein